jgi:CBS domain containing-hemolysin-like protein
MTLLIFYFCLAIGFSFLCSILEAVLLSITPSFVNAVKEEGKPSGALLERLKTQIDRPLSAILSLNTIAHTVGAAGVGAQAQVVFQSLPVTVISAVLTLLILIFSEIIPKSLGANYWRSLAVPSAYTMQVLTTLMWPLVVLSQSISKLMTPSEGMPSISREEIAAMADLGHQQGVIDSEDAGVLRNVIAFQSIRVSNVFTPRKVVQTVDSSETVAGLMERKDPLTFSRYPVMTSAESVVGYVLRSDILSAAARDEWDRKLAEFTREVVFITLQTPLKRCLGIFIKRQEHMAIVVDEFGSFAGVLTLEDVVETLIGYEIMDEGDAVEDLRTLVNSTTAEEAK